MEIAIIQDKSSFILYRNEVIDVCRDENDSTIYKGYDIRELTKYTGEVSWLMDNGYYTECDDMKCILTMDALIEEEKAILMKEQSEYLWRHRYCSKSLYKDIDIEDIQEFYDFELEMEIEGMRIKIMCSLAYMNAVYVPIPYKEHKDMEPENKMTRILGEPKFIPEQESQYGKLEHYYIVPVSKIDKIIGIKKYRDIHEFDVCTYPCTYIKEEEIVLDLKHFNPDVFMFFEDRRMIATYYDVEIRAEWIYKD